MFYYFLPLLSLLHVNNLYLLSTVIYLIDFDKEFLKNIKKSATIAENLMNNGKPPSVTSNTDLNEHIVQMHKDLRNGKVFNV